MGPLVTHNMYWWIGEVIIGPDNGFSLVRCQAIELSNWSLDKMPSILQTTFSNTFSWIKINAFQLKFPKVPIDNIPALVQIMAWRLPGDKPLSEPMALGYWRIYASLGLKWVNENSRFVSKTFSEQRHSILVLIQRKVFFSNFIESFWLQHLSHSIQVSQYVKIMKSGPHERWKCQLCLRTPKTHFDSIF